MRVDGGVVNPRHERRVTHERERHRARGVVAVVSGVVVFAAALGILFAVVAPWLADAADLALDVRGGVALVAASMILGFGTMLLLWRASDARWKRVRTDPDLVRSTYYLFDEFGPDAAALDDATLWEALTEQHRIDELRVAHREMLEAMPDHRGPSQQATLDALAAEIHAAQREQHERLSGPR